MNKYGERDKERDTYTHTHTPHYILIYHIMYRLHILWVHSDIHTHTHTHKMKTIFVCENLSYLFSLPPCLPLCCCCRFSSVLYIHIPSSFTQFIRIQLTHITIIFFLFLLHPLFLSYSPRNINKFTNTIQYDSIQC